MRASVYVWQATVAHGSAGNKLGYKRPGKVAFGCFGRLGALASDAYGVEAHSFCSSGCVCVSACVSSIDLFFALICNLIIFIRPKCQSVSFSYICAHHVCY